MASRGTFYIKDSSGTLKEVLPKSYNVITEYEGATDISSGIAGLVPVAFSSQKDKFLRGDGNWSNSTTTIFKKVVTLTGNEIDLNLGGIFVKTVTENISFNFSNAPTTGFGVHFTLVLINGGSYTVTFPTSVQWNNSEIPHLATDGTDILSFMTYDSGTTWFGTTWFRSTYFGTVTYE